MAIQSFTAGEILDSSRMNELVAAANELKEKTLVEEHLLHEGQKYLDASSNYTLWSADKHKEWDYVRVYVSYDPQGRQGTNGMCFEINCGPTYYYSGDASSHSTLCCTYGTTYRRLCVTTTGLNVVASGNGTGWYLEKVIGVIKKTVE